MEFHGIEKLRGAENWTIWKFAVRNLLRGTDGTYEVCTGEIEKPKQLGVGATEEQRATYKLELKEWDKGDRLASQIIIRTVEAKVIALLVACESARDMWIKLHAVFEQQTKQAAHTVQAEFFSFKMNATDDMVTHIARFEGLVLRMQQLNVKPDESSLMVKLMDTLPDDYESLRQAWWARPENQQTFVNLMGILTSDEQRRKQRSEQKEELVALMAKSKTPGSGSQDRFHKKLTKDKGKEKKKFKCYACGGTGHFRRECPTSKQKSQKSHVNLSDGDQAFVIETMNAELDDDRWIVDSGATDHLSHHREWFSSFEQFEVPVKVHIGNKTSMDAVGKGTIKFEASVNGKWLPSFMQNVLYVPTARRNLFSVTSALDKGMLFNSSKNSCEFVKDGIIKARGIRFGQLFRMLIRIKKPEKLPVLTPEVNLTSQNTLQIWHERLGHQSKRHVQKILKQHGINVVVDNEFCVACVKGKQHRDSFQSRQQRAKEPGEIIHADLCGPMETTSLGGSKYFACFTCDFTRQRMVYFLKEKSETVKMVEEMLHFVKNQCGRTIKGLQSDGGTEFYNSEVLKLLKANGIKFIISNPYTPEQNGCAERTNRTVVELARTMLLSKNVSKSLWAEAVNTAVYILNRTGPSSVEGKTPYELFTGKQAHMNKFHIFGTECYVHVPRQCRRKWDAKGQRGIFVGYSDEIDGYRVFTNSKNKIVRSRNVVFEPDNTKNLAFFPPETNNTPDEDENEESTLGSENTHVEESSESIKDRLRNRDQIRKPDRLVETMLTEVCEPINYAEAMKSEERVHWKAAMEEEISSLDKNSTWMLTELPVGRKAISNRWVYRIKRNSNGDISRYKARLVIRGYSQRKGIDYNETFSPVARFDTIRAVLSVAANENLQLGQFDVKTAFLNGILEEEIYMQQPEGYEDNTNRVGKLQKSLYGLKQSPRCWNKRFKDVLISFGLRESTADPCLFYRIIEGNKLVVVIYVDDGLIAGSNKGDIEEFLNMLKTEFEITVEPVGYFLNVMIQRDERGSIFIHQKQYAEGILRRFNMFEANAVSTPIEKYLQSEEVMDTETTSAPYREAVGCLMYLAVATRPDISFALSYVSQFLENPNKMHWALVKRVMKYIKGTTMMGIQYSALKNTGELEAYSDADYASDPKTRRSVSGIIFKYSGGAITWASRRQNCVSLSTTEAEYIAASEAAKEAVWLNRLFNEIVILKTAPVLLVDNASAIRLTKNTEFHKRSKHIDVRYHFVRERIQEGQLIIKHVSSKMQLADILTKPVPRVQFELLRSMLGMG